MDENGNDRPDAGEAIALTVLVVNTGTVTLDAISLSDSIESAGCAASDPFRLAQGGQHTCVPILQVSTSSQNHSLRVLGYIYIWIVLSRKSLYESMGIVVELHATDAFGLKAVFCTADRRLRANVFRKHVDTHG